MLQRQRAFTLIELMIVIAIIGILAAIAIPAYQDYVRKSRRTDATVAMSKIQQAQEKWRASNATYTATLSNLGITSSATDNGYYAISIGTNCSTNPATGTPTTTAYCVNATAQNAQTGDKSACRTLRLEVSNGNANIYDNTTGTNQTCVSK
jgi:type IV pilus assembly protein PilE